MQKSPMENEANKEDGHIDETYTFVEHIVITNYKILENVQVLEY